MFAVSVFLLASGHRLRAADDDEALIVECTRPCAAVTAAVAAAGGVVTQHFENVDAVAVRVPRAMVTSLGRAAGAKRVRKDLEIALPVPRAMTAVTDHLASPDVLTGIALEENLPANYRFNLDFTNVSPLHAAGRVGQNVVVAVIDSGTANVPGIPALSGSVIGGETFVPVAVDPLSATHRENGAHGTMTAEMIAAHAVFLFSSTSGFVRALNRYAPGSAIPCTTFPGNCGLPPPVAAIASAVPMTGTAPGATIYAMKVFPAFSNSAPESRIIAAMDRAITLRRNYNMTGVNTVASGTGTETDPFVYSALKIDVVNMSLGGPTLFAGRDIMDSLTLSMLDVGMTLVASAGNNGPAAMTVASPGTGFGSLTVGAASTAAHERILVDLQFGPGAGEIYRPTSHAQSASFSSRGPTADGRFDPDVTANGANAFVHAYLALTPSGALTDCRFPGALPGTCVPRIVFVDGTSFSSPTVAGGAAILRSGHPAKSAAQIRNALQQSANPNLLGDDSTPIDQGNGVVDVLAADALLASGAVSSQLPDVSLQFHDDDDGLGSGGRSVLRSVERAGFHLARFAGNHYSAWIQDLEPGEVAQIFVPSDSLTSKFTVTIDQVTPTLPPDEQNQFWICGPPGMEFLCGDDVFVQVVDAPTSLDVPRAGGFPNSQEPLTAEIDNPQTGLVRVALLGSTTNGGDVSARVTITRQRRFDELPTSTSTIEQDEIDFVEVDVPFGVSEAVFELSWLQNWARYPTNDLDLALIDPAGNIINGTDATSSPERIRIANPAGGRWTAAIIGLTIHGHGGHESQGGEESHTDVYTLRADADGKRLKPAK